MEDVVEPLEEFRPGHSIDEIQIKLELYRLVTMILASGEIQTNFLQGLAERYFVDELSRILISVAIQGRLYSSMKYPGSFPIWAEACAELEQAPSSDAPLGEGPLDGKIIPLTLKEAFNKIIHATIMNTDSEVVSDGDSLATTNRIKPTLYLYGRHMNGKPWRVTLELMEFVRLMNLALPRLG
jgi:hypothetical protein